MSLHPATLFIRLREAGLIARADRGRLLVSPISALTGDLRDAVIEHRLSLLAWLEAEADDLARAEAMALRTTTPWEGDTEAGILIAMHEEGDEPSYYLTTESQLATLVEFCRLHRTAREAKDARRAAREAAKARTAARKQDARETPLLEASQ